MIRLANLHDVDAIMNFIHHEWKENHILSKNKDFFLYEHRAGTEINFAISIDDDQQINGLLGFIPSSYAEKADICTVIWKVAKRAGNPMLGMQLLEFLRDLGRFRTVMSVGINEKTIGIYKYMNMYTGRLKQYVLVNPALSEMRIAKLPPEMESPVFSDPESRKLIPLDRDFSFNFEKYINNIQYKDARYFNKRYFDHPIYKYNVFGIVYNKSISSILVMRVESAEQSQVLRIVDFIGDESELKYISKELCEILKDNKYEYADFFCYGLGDSQLKQAGFIEVDPDAEALIIPNYFQPFIRKNIKVNFFSDTEGPDNLRLFKADGDQDRPN
ncbi:hypothetical protein SAMN05421820_105167 [Pedobacter steynii]|uniref:Uncharacterized protein n=1 Tax=Pedobacter steynii TaxID=430522 RepID=A0A1G9WGM6_9SPHI|nr:hypothetical protein [Pedobacter steynii]NQX40291.1 hypothetical protein [Pedobacter steynii]SDM83619.1 hypothetical protein SAMN05421820_105167 [Pedobacter steynii]